MVSVQRLGIRLFLAPVAECLRPDHSELPKAPLATRAQPNEAQVPDVVVFTTKYFVENMVFRGTRHFLRGSEYVNFGKNRSRL